MITRNPLLTGLLLLFFALHILVPAAAETPAALPADIGPSIEDYVARHADTTAGLSVAVFDAHQTLYRQHFGYMDVENKIPVDGDTVMEWGSVSKLLIWVSVMQLVEQGQIDLQADIQTYLPAGFLKHRAYDVPITMLHLMHHNAGFEEYILGMCTGKEERIPSLEAYLTSFQPRQIFEPGTVCAYSNWGTCLAAYIVERISGMPYHQYARQHIFEPLGMHDTALRADLNDQPDVKERRMALRIYTDEVEEITPNFSYIVMYPAGMCVSTLADMQKFAQSLLSEDTPLLRSKETYAALFSPSLYFSGTDVPRNCHGFWSLGCYDRQIIGHNGNTAGCSSSLLLDLENRVGMVIQANQAGEQIYNRHLPELLFGAYEGPVWDEAAWLMSARTIFCGPFKLYKVLAIDNIVPEEKPLDVYSIRASAPGPDRIEQPYGDALIISPRALAPDILTLALYLVSLCFCLISAAFRLIRALYRRIRGRRGRHAWAPWCMAASLLPLTAVSLYAGMLPSLFNFQQWPVSGYRLALLLVLVCALVMLLLIVQGCRHAGKYPMKKLQRLNVYLHIVCLAISIFHILYWQWGMFWLLG